MSWKADQKIWSGSNQKKILLLLVSISYNFPISINLSKPLKKFANKNFEILYIMKSWLAPDLGKNKPSKFNRVDNPGQIQH